MRVFKQPIFAEAPSSMGRGRTFFKIYSGLALLQGYAYLFADWILYPVHKLSTSRVSVSWVVWWLILSLIFSIWVVGGMLLINNGKDGRCPNTKDAIGNQWCGATMIWSVPTFWLLFLVYTIVTGERGGVAGGDATAEYDEHRRRSPAWSNAPGNIWWWNGTSD